MKIEKIREQVADKKLRNQLIESLGDTDLDWLGFDRAEDIVEYIDWAMKNGHAERWTDHLGSRTALSEHINRYRKPL